MQLEREWLSRTIVARKEEKKGIMASLVVSRKVYGEAVIDYNCLQEAHTGLSGVTDFESDESREGSRAPVPERLVLGRPPAEQFLDAESEESVDDLCVVVINPPNLEAGEGPSWAEPGVVAGVANVSDEEN